MAWELRPARTHFAESAAEWDRLNAACNKAHPFLDSRFIGSLLHFFGDGRELLCLHRSAGECDGALIVAPLGLGRWRLFRPPQAQLGALLLRSPDSLGALLATLPGYAWTLELLGIDPRFAPHFDGTRMPLITGISSHSMGIDLDGAFATYWSRRPKKLVANMRRYFGRAEREFGDIDRSRLTDPELMAAAVERYGRLESAGWKGSAGTAVAPGSSQAAFYSEIMRAFAQTGQATIYELSVASRLAASRLILSASGMVVFVKTAYDESLARIAPGRLLLHKVLEEKFANEARLSIEFYTDANRDLLEWSSYDLLVRNLQVFRSENFAAAFVALRTPLRLLRGPRRRANRDGADLIDMKASSHDSLDACIDQDAASGTLGDPDNFELSPDWLRLLQETVYRDDRGVRHYAVRSRDGIRTLLSVRLAKEGVVKTIHSLSNFYSSLFAPLSVALPDPLDLGEIIAAATREMKGAQVARFAPMDPESAGFGALLSGLRAAGWIPLRYFCFGNWYLRVDGDWEAYLKKRTAGLRSTIKRMRKKFDGDGGTLEILSGPADVERAVAAFETVYSASWKVPEPYPDFIPELTRRLAARGLLRMGVAWLDGQPIAAQLWVVTGSRAAIYKVAYHEAHAQYSPGTLVTAMLMQHVIEQDRVREVDFLIGDDKYKQIWMSDRRERWGIVAYNPRTLIGTTLLLREVAGRAVKRLIARLRQLRSSPKDE